MGISPGCNWPQCDCKTEKNEPCKFENPDFYINKRQVGTMDDLQRQMIRNARSDVDAVIRPLAIAVENGKKPTMKQLREMRERLTNARKWLAGAMPGE